MGTKRENGLIPSDDTFVVLMRAAQEEPLVRKRLLPILRLDSRNRASLLDTMVSELRLQGAPSDFVEAIGLLKNDDVAEKALGLLENEDGESVLWTSLLWIAALTGLALVVYLVIRTA